MHRNVLRLLIALCVAAIFSAHSSAQFLSNTAKADHILVVKSTHTMTLYSGGKVLKTYRVSLGSGAGNAKRKQGDRETPEGNYVIDSRNPHSGYHLALHVSYPNAADRARAKALHADPGGDVMIHGLPAGFAWISRAQQLSDWTNGCIALSDAEMDEVWKLVPTGTPIEIRH
jgi:murein L,D-transpeptidase YafK